jgi:uncharacterized repeat protein (TIGR03803 family)
MYYFNRSKIRPQSELIFDASGNLYGTTADGGSHDDGTVFELTPGTNGTWKEKVLHSFNGRWRAIRVCRTLGWVERLKRAMDEDMLDSDHYPKRRYRDRPR